MSSSIYVFKTHAINLSNLVHYHIVGYNPDQFYKTCEPYAIGKFLFSTPGSSLIDIAHPIPVRQFDWSQHLGVLIKEASLAKAQNQILTFGNHNQQQLSLLKKHFNSDIKIITINYGQHLYQYLLNNMAQYHVYMLTHGLLQPNSIDLDVLTKPNLAVNYYYNAFDDMNIIPTSSQSYGDYNIQIDDFFNPELMHQHFDNLGCPTINTKPGIYHTWYKAVLQDMDVPSLINCT